ncbi:GNAT family N-acetyltransferase [Streptomyces sporangiiformans]|uniref:N-acetyltransferase n=1 Tax=Streptomyces sporangiiformans TaxID=2315329 RepID=A0A505DIQ7_9ACTN|nr:N-acetyltransferase [Streptomyces sporangiiformans]TPQ18129.1 N-acetyltransferase [Streptomyces sporangiiformans]
MREITIRDDRGRGRLEAYADAGSADSGSPDSGPPGTGSADASAEVVGHIAYFVLDAPERALVPVHTIVEPAHEGRGIAGSLARELYAVAAREDVPVAPLCPYVEKWAERHRDEAPAPDPGLIDAAKQWLRAHPDRF